MLGNVGRIMKNNYKILLGKKIQDIRKSKKLSQRALADKLGKGNGTVSSIERGQRNVTIDTLEKIANALDIEVAELVSLNKTNYDMPRILQELKSKHPDVSEMYLSIFDYCCRQGLKFKSVDDCYYFWIIIQAINTRK